MPKYSFSLNNQTAKEQLSSLKCQKICILQRRKGGGGGRDRNIPMYYTVKKKSNQETKESEKYLKTQWSNLGEIKIKKY